MRAIRRWIRYQYAEHRIAERRNIIRSQLADVLEGQIQFQLSGNRGQDSIYIVYCDDVPKAVLRLANPHRKEKKMDMAMPYIPLPAAKRLLQEWHAYEQGADKGLTPHPLWRCNDAIVCKFLPYSRLHSELLESPNNFWQLIVLASQRLSELHKIGLVHMDASLANILTDPSKDHLVFVDFEYGPNMILNTGQQRAYDYLRLLESSMKYIPPGKNTEHEVWLDLLASLLDQETKQADLLPLLPALPRLQADSCLWLAVQLIFPAAKL